MSPLALEPQEAAAVAVTLELFNSNQGSLNAAIVERYLTCQYHLESGSVLTDRALQIWASFYSCMIMSARCPGKSKLFGKPNLRSASMPSL
jgi:hypothetical protein